MKYKILKTSSFLFFVFLSYLFAQEELDPLKFEAWVVEYPGYRLLIKNAIINYRDMNPDEQADIHEPKTSDKYIIVRSYMKKGDIYQLWFGSGSKFTILDRKKVEWIFGKTLRETLLDREGYFSNDTRIVFMGEGGKEQKAIDYLNNLTTWSNTDLVLGLDRVVSGVSILSPKSTEAADYSVVARWGNEQLGYPYRSLGLINIGVLNRFFELGVQMPTVTTYLNGMVIEPTDVDRSLNGGWGGYGRFSLKKFNGQISFTTPAHESDAASLALTDSANVNVMSLSYLFNFSLPLKGILPFDIGTVVLKPGVFSYRVAHRSIVAGEYIDRVTNTLGNDYDSADTDYRGLFLRLEGISKLTTGGFPRLEYTAQLLVGDSFLTSVTANINGKFGVSATYVQFIEEHEWAPLQAAYFGARISLNP